MTARSFARVIYLLLLWMHPLAFRKRYGDELLWIFDRSAGDGQMAYLLCDGVRSAIVQHAGFDPQEESPSFLGLEVRASSLTFGRLGQATVLSGGLLLLAAFLLAREMPPLSVLDQRPACQLAAQAKQAAHLEIRK